jgi:hypothetical protein
MHYKKLSKASKRLIPYQWSNSLIVGSLGLGASGSVIT